MGRICADAFEQCLAAGNDGVEAVELYIAGNVADAFSLNDPEIPDRCFA